MKPPDPVFSHKQLNRFAFCTEVSIQICSYRPSKSKSNSDSTRHNSYLLYLPIYQKSLRYYNTAVLQEKIPMPRNLEIKAYHKIIEETQTSSGSNTPTVGKDTFQ